MKFQNTKSSEIADKTRDGFLVSVR